MELLLQLAEEKQKENNTKETQKFEDDVREFKALATKMYQEKYAEQQRQIAEEESKKTANNEYLLSLGRPAVQYNGLSLPNMPGVSPPHDEGKLDGAVKKN